MPSLPKIPYREYQHLNRQRADSMALSDQLRILAKSTISLLLKNKIEAAEKNMAPMKKTFNQLQKNLKNNPYLYAFTVLNIGPEEYLEALFLYSYIKNKPMPSAQKMGINPEIFLGGLSDMTGELVRLARRDEKQTQAIYAYITKIYDLIIPITVTRNSSTRTKLEAIHNNLKKIENIIYDLKLRDKL